MSSTLKRLRDGTERTTALAETFERATALMGGLGITRIADITGLDRVGIPVVAVCRPNSRSVSVAQGKGTTQLAARVSGLMESIEGYCAEHMRLPLLLGSYREVRAEHPVVNLDGMPRLSTSCFEPGLRMLWVSGTELHTGKSLLVPYEAVHTDFRWPLPTGSGAFLMSSNGLASGNHLFEAISHAICELVERDANTLWHLGGSQSDEQRRLDLTSVDDPSCRALIEQIERAELAVHAWETTSDVGISSFLCVLAERDVRAAQKVSPVTGSGCHPRRAIALSRALTEAAQGRLTHISGSRDDLAARFYDPDAARSWEPLLRELDGARGLRNFSQAPDQDFASLEEDVNWELGQLRAAGLEQAIVVNLTKPELGIPVVKVVIPHLEGMSEVVDFVPGKRARNIVLRAG